MSHKPGMRSFVIVPGTAKGKRFKALFYNERGKRIKTVQFGDSQAAGRTYIDGASRVTRNNYIARHRVREDWTNPFSRGALSRYIIWETPDLHTNINLFKKRFQKHFS